MKHEDGRVTMLPKQIRRLAKLAEMRDSAIEIAQAGSVLTFSNGVIKFSVDASGNDFPPLNQEKLC